MSFVSAGYMIPGLMLGEGLAVYWRAPPSTSDSVSKDVADTSWLPLASEMGLQTMESLLSRPWEIEFWGCKEA